MPLDSYEPKGVWAPSLRPGYDTYKSPHGPKYEIGRNYHGVHSGRLLRFAKSSAMFGVAGVIGLLFFAQDVPRVRIDIMQRVPIFGSYFVREVPPEDDPF